jgi:ABC-type multidrug transport system ATPase subunit
VIRTTGLTKRYGRLTAVEDVNLSIPAGQIYGFLGPNGAGKTSTIMMLLGITLPTAGEIHLFGEHYSSDRLDLRKRIGVVPERHPRGVWSWMTANEYLRYFADLFSVANPQARIAALLEQVGLSEAANRRIAGFSRGMLQKLSIVRALLHDPDILFLDEPHSGLDPFGMKQVRDLIVAENREGRTIFVSSHLLSEVERICDRVAIIFKGRLLAEDSMARILDRFSETRELRVELENPPAGLVEAARALPFVREAGIQGSTLTVQVARDRDYRKDISQFLIGRGLVPLSLEEKSLSLEEAFVTITGENLSLFTDAEAGHARRE